VRDFPAWREESVRLAPEAFAFVSAPAAEHAQHPPIEYQRWMKETAEHRVALAEYRLADVLREIFAGA
jgi:hypothetical protein